MAKYIGPDGEVYQLDEDRTFQPSGNVGKKGEWVITQPDGRNVLSDPAYFATAYRQVFPRAADAEEKTAANVLNSPSCA